MVDMLYNQTKPKFVGIAVLRLKIIGILLLIKVDNVVSVN